MKIIVYKFRNILNNKIYIGITSRSLNRRIEQHVSNSKKPKLYFHKALKKYGIDNFEILILDIVEDYEIAKKQEIFYIKEFNSKAPNGYNSTNGGDGQLGTANFKGKKHSKEECIKIGKRSIGNKFALGSKRTQKQKDAVSKAQIGRKRTKESILRMRKSKSKSIICLNDNNKFLNGSEAAKFYNLCESDVYRVLSKKYKHTKGYKFEYI